jgi:hypothetical protein
VDKQTKPSSQPSSQPEPKPEPKPEPQPRRFGDSGTRYDEACAGCGRETVLDNDSDLCERCWVPPRPAIEVAREAELWQIVDASIAAVETELGVHGIGGAARRLRYPRR